MGKLIDSSKIQSLALKRVQNYTARHMKKAITGEMRPELVAACIDGCSRGTTEALALILGITTGDAEHQEDMTVKLQNLVKNYSEKSHSEVLQGTLAVDFSEKLTMEYNAAVMYVASVAGIPFNNP